MNVLYLDLLPDYVPFMVQCKSLTGAKKNPVGGIDLKIYEQDSSSFDDDDVLHTAWENDELASGDFNEEFGDEFAELPIYKVNSKTGYYGILVPKTIFEAGKEYCALWETTVDDVQTAKEELFCVCNSTSFQG